MRLRDAVRFSLELVLPDKVVQAIDRYDRSRAAGAPNTNSTARTNPVSRQQQIIEEIDIARHGGLSFGPETISRMTVAFERAISTLLEPVEPSHIRMIAECVMDAAAGGERNPDRLQTMALEDFARKIEQSRQKNDPADAGPTAEDDIATAGRSLGTT